LLLLLLLSSSSSVVVVVVVVVVGEEEEEEEEYKIIIKMTAQQPNYKLLSVTAKANGIKFLLWNRKFKCRRVDVAQHGSTSGHTREMN
jgi:hypothetical protein